MKKLEYVSPETMALAMAVQSGVMSTSAPDYGSGWSYDFDNGSYNGQ